MKIFKKVIIPFLVTAMFLVSCKQEKKKDDLKKSKDSKVSVLKKIPRDFKTNERKKYKDANKVNLDVLKKESYFDLKNKIVKIKAPVLDKDFRIYYYRWFEKDNKKGLFIGVSNKKEITTRNSLGNLILEEDIKFSSINGKIKLNKNDKLYVLIHNDIFYSKSKSDIELKKIINFLEFDAERNMFFITTKFRPDEEGGGVIIEGP